ncbi:hypothetical protein [Raoultella terrigena]|uniref:hypothetical protein n=1 Tax=Raoultella terrigena TaxID=577 RepID=UPI000976B1F7|nr:hypothetical protein [Raoultella terrigena]OMP92208.1 hypothetical protein BZP36_18895 [Raoultella terrigena]
MKRYHASIRKPGTRVEDGLSRGLLTASPDQFTGWHRTGILVMYFDQGRAELRRAFILEEGYQWN